MDGSGLGQVPLMSLTLRSLHYPVFGSFFVVKPQYSYWSRSRLEFGSLQDAINHMLHFTMESNSDILLKGLEEAAPSIVGPILESHSKKLAGNRGVYFYGRTVSAR